MPSQSIRSCKRFISSVFICLGLASQCLNANEISSDLSLDNMEIRAFLTPLRKTTLAAEFDAKINIISVTEGESFTANQTIVSFDCSLQKAQRQKASATLKGTKNTLKGNERLAELNAIGQVELENSKIEVLKAEADLKYLDTTLKKCAVKAPFKGKAGEIHTTEQQYVTSGQPLLEIFDDSVLELEFIIPSRWLSRVKTGHLFSVHIDEIDKAYPAKLIRTSGRIDPVSQSIKAVANIDGQYPELIAGMSGRIIMFSPSP